MSRVKVLIYFSALFTVNIVGIAVGVAVAGIVLLVILPTVIVVVIACRLCNRRNRYETVIVNTPATPATTVYAHTGYGSAGVYHPQ